MSEKELDKKKKGEDRNTRLPVPGNRSEKGGREGREGKEGEERGKGKRG